MDFEKDHDEIPAEILSALEDLNTEVATLADLIRYLALHSDQLSESLPPPPADMMN